MQPVSREAKNLFTIFSVWGGRLRRGGAFLTGVALVALFALSAPSAQATGEKLTIAVIDDVVAGDEGWVIAIDDVAADAGGWITAINDVSNNGGITAYSAETDNGGFAAFGDIDDLVDGIVAFGEVEDEIDNLGNDIEINDVDTETESEFSVDALADDYVPEFYSHAPIEHGKFFAIGTFQAIGMIEVADTVDIGEGIDAEIATEQLGGTNCYRTSKSIIECDVDKKYGAITTRGKHYSGDDDNQTAILVSHSGSDEDDFLFLVNEVEKIDNVRDGIVATYSGDEDVSIVSRNKSEIVAENNGIAARHHGSGRVDVQMWDSKVFSEEGDAILIEHFGTGDVEAYIHGEVRGKNAGISASLIDNDEGGIYIWGLSGSKISGSTGIEAHIDDFSRGGYFDDTPHIIYVDVSGTVSGDEIAVNMSGGHYNQLLLRPNSKLNGAAVANSDSYYNYLTLTSARNGEDVLDLSEYEFRGFNNLNTIDGKFTLTGTASEEEAFETVVHGKLRFSNVDYRVRDKGNFTIRTDNSFDGLDKRGTLEIESKNVLRGGVRNNGDIVFVSAGKPDTLTITDWYRSETFYPDEEKDILPEVIFKVGSDSWDNDQLLIKGSYINRGGPNTKVSVDAPSIVSKSFPVESPILIEVLGSAAGGTPEGAFYGDQTIGAHEYVLEYKADGKKFIDMLYRGKYNEIDNQVAEIDDRLSEIIVELRDLGDIIRSRFDNNENVEQRIWDKKLSLINEENDLIKKRDDLFYKRREIDANWDEDILNSKEPEGAHMWYFRRNGLSDFAVNVSDETGNVAEEVATKPDENAIIEVDVKHSLRASGAPNDRFRVNLDIPAMRFMGGDLVVGTSLTQGFSTSSIDEVTGMSNSIGQGYDFGVLGLSFSPQVELLWTRIDFDDFVGPNGEIVSLEDGDIVTGRLGLLFSGDYIYGGVNLRTAIDGRTTINVSGTSIASEQDNLSIDGLLGFSYDWSEDHETYGELFMDADEVRANLGVRIDF